MQKLVKRQHYVPQTYLRAWANQNEQIKVRDLKEKKSFPSAVENVLLENYYYENPDQAPTNELEAKFCQYEADFSNTRNFLLGVVSNAVSNAQDPAQCLESMFSAMPKHAKTIRAFAATSYFRTPGALSAMQTQLANDKDSEHAIATLDTLNSPYSLNTMAFNSSLLERFENLHLIVLIAEGSLNTCDRPCFPIIGGIGHSNFGFDIGRHPDAIAAMPIAPHLFATFLPNLKNHEAVNLARPMSDVMLQKTNEVILAKTHRWLIWAP